MDFHEFMTFSQDDKKNACIHCENVINEERTIFMLYHYKHTLEKG